MNILLGEHAAQLILQQITEILPIAEQRNLYPDGKNLRQCRESIWQPIILLYSPQQAFLPLDASLWELSWF